MLTGNFYSGKFGVQGPGPRTQDRVSKPLRSVRRTSQNCPVLHKSEVSCLTDLHCLPWNRKEGKICSIVRCTPYFLPSINAICYKLRSEADFCGLAETVNKAKEGNCFCQLQYLLYAQWCLKCIQAKSVFQCCQICV